MTIAGQRRMIIQNSDDEDSNDEDLGLGMEQSAETLVSSPSSSTQLQIEQHDNKRLRRNQNNLARGSSWFIRSSSEVYESPKKGLRAEEWDIPSSAPISGSNGEKVRTRNALRDSGIEVETPTVVRFKKEEEGKNGDIEKMGKKTKSRKGKRKRGERGVIDENLSQKITVDIPVLKKKFGRRVCESEDETLGLDFGTIDPAKLTTEPEDLETVDMVEDDIEGGFLSNPVNESIDLVFEQNSQRSKTSKLEKKVSSDRAAKQDDIFEIDGMAVLDKTLGDDVQDPQQEQGPPSKKRGRPRKVNSQRPITSAASSQHIYKSMDTPSQAFSEERTDDTRVLQDDSIVLETERATATPSIREDILDVNDTDEEPREKDTRKIKKKKRCRKEKKAKPSNGPRESKEESEQGQMSEEVPDDNHSHDNEQSTFLEVDPDPAPATEQSNALEELTSNTSPKKMMEPDSGNQGTLMATNSLRTPEKPAPNRSESHSPLNSGKVPYRVGLSKSARIQPLLRVVNK
jgi:hypothetical protein